MEEKLLKASIIDLEKNIEQSIPLILKKYQPYFCESDRKLVLQLERIDVSNKSKPFNVEHCLSKSYYSYVSIAVLDSDGNLIGDEENGYIIENVAVWSVDNSIFSFKKRNNLPELKAIIKEIETTVIEFMSM